MDYSILYASNGRGKMLNRFLIFAGIVMISYFQFCTSPRKVNTWAAIQPRPLGISIPNLTVSSGDTIANDTINYFLIDNYEFRTGITIKESIDNGIARRIFDSSIIAINLSAKKHYVVNNIYEQVIKKGLRKRPDGIYFDELAKGIQIPLLYHDDQMGNRNFAGKSQPPPNSSDSVNFYIQLANIPRKDSFYVFKKEEQLYRMRLTSLRIKAHKGQFIFNCKLYYYKPQADSVLLFKKLIQKLDASEI